MGSPVALCIGNVLLDVTCECSDDFLLKKYDLKPDDGIELSDWQMSLFDDILSNKNNHIIVADVGDYKNSSQNNGSTEISFRPDLHLTPGGAAQNTARVMQWCLDNTLGKNSVAFTGCVGKDRVAMLLEGLVQKEGVQVHYMNHPTSRTGACAALVTKNNQRSLCANIGASSHFSTEYLKTPKLQQTLQKVNAIYCEGFFLTHSVNCVLDLVNFTPNTLFCLNLSATYVCDKFFSDILNVFPYVDILFGNTEEFILLAKKFEIEDGLRLEQLLICLSEKLPVLDKLNAIGRTLVVTRGSESVLVVTPDCEIFSYQVPHVENIVDTIGAGDSFVAGFLGAKVLKDSLCFSVTCGIRVACKMIQQRGCSIPKDVINLMNLEMIAPQKID